MTIVEKIRVLANNEGMSLPDLEVKLGLGNGTISRWNKSKPNTDKLVVIADHFHVSTDYLLGREGEDKDNTELPTYDNLLKIYTRGKNNLSPQEKMKLAQIILSDEEN
jgi:transcriptional regulator with XRE-family HTH domain